MKVTKHPLFYFIGITIYLFLKFKWLYVFKHLFRNPKTRKVKPEFHQNVYKNSNKTLVSIVKGDNIYSMLKEGIELIGGLGKIDIKGKSVLIKPNIVNRYPSPANTNPYVIKAIIKLLQEYGASKILVGDMSAIFALPTKKNAIKSGFWEVIHNEDIQFVSFEDRGWVEVDIPEGRFIKKAIVSEVLYEVDKIINVPVIKTHNYATYTISLKNFIGAVHAKQRPYFITPDYWEEIVAELNAAYTPHLNIIDGTRIIIKGGPTKGKIAEPNLIIVTGDRIAADIVGLSIIKAFGEWERISNKDVWAQRQIKRAIELRLGVSGPSELKIVSKCQCADKSEFEELIQKIHQYSNVS